MANLSSYIRELREKMGLQQNQLAEKAGISPAALSLIENGERKRPTLVVLRKLATALEIDVVELMVNGGLIDPEEASTEISSTGPVMVFGSGIFPEGNPVLEKMFKAMKDGYLSKDDIKTIDNIITLMRDSKRSDS